MPAAVVGIAVVLNAAPAFAESAAQAMQAFGLIGTWSPDCAGPIRLVYAAPPGGAPTFRMFVHGREVVVSEIQQAFPLRPGQIKWISVIKKWSVLTPRKPWMPQPGETWQTVIVKLGDRIRSLQSQRTDGKKIGAKNGFSYIGDDVKGADLVIWRNTGKPTPLYTKCRVSGPEPRAR